MSRKGRLVATKEAGSHSLRSSNGDSGLLLRQLLDGLVLMGRLGVGDDLKWPLSATGILDVGCSVATFAGEEGEKERREKEGPAGPLAHFCSWDQTCVHWGCRLCVWEAWWLGWPRGRPSGPGDRALPTQWRRPAQTDLLSRPCVSALWSRAEWSLSFQQPSRPAE